MVRIGRNATLDVEFNVFMNKYLQWLPTRPEAATEPDPYIQKLSQGNTKPINIDIYAGGQDLLSIRDNLIARDVEFTDNGPALNPEPGQPDPEPPLGYDKAISDQAILNIITAKKDALDTEFQTEYANLGGTGTAPNPEWKHYRWALSGQ